MPKSVSSARKPRPKPRSLKAVEKTDLALARSLALSESGVAWRDAGQRG